MTDTTTVFGSYLALCTSKKRMTEVVVVMIYRMTWYRPPATAGRQHHGAQTKNRNAEIAIA
jgi:hypothetical protein